MVSGSHMSWETRVQISTLPQIPCVTLGKSQSLCASAPRLSNGNSISLSLRDVVRINPLRAVRCSDTVGMGLDKYFRQIDSERCSPLDF